MIDYTYWQYRLRGRIKPQEIDYRPIRLERYANFLIGVQKMDAQREERFKQSLTDFQACLAKSLRWLFQPQGEIVLSKNLNKLSEDNLMLLGLANGINEVYFDEHDLVYMICPLEKLDDLCEILALDGVIIAQALKSYRPEGLLEIYEKRTAQKVFNFCQRLCREEYIVDMCADFAIGEIWAEEFEQNTGK